MERRNWPWKKKSFDKAAGEKYSTALVPNVGLASSNGSDQDYKKTKYVQISVDVYSHLTGLEERVNLYGDEVKTLEDALDDLRQKLSESRSEVASKDVSAKQHAKVAEEAVSGWEKTEEEAATLKTTLEEVRASNLAVEDRASCLEGALKECMREIRTLKEEHQAALSLSRDWEKQKLGLDSKIQDTEQKLLRSMAENTSLSRSLQERTVAFSQAHKEKSQVEVEAELLREGLLSSEKELKSLRYELHLSSKELEIRNEEKDLSRRSADAATRMHHDSVRRVARLESECNRLRGLLRKKLPGPAALAQMKLEAADLGPGVRRHRPGEMEVLRAELRASKELCSKLSNRIHDLEICCVGSPRGPDVHSLAGSRAGGSEGGPVAGEGRSNDSGRLIDRMGIMDDFLEMEKLAEKGWSREGGGGCPDPDSVLVFGARVREDRCGPGPGREDDVSGDVGKGEMERVELEAALKANVLAETQVRCMAEAYRALEAGSEEMRAELQRVEVRAAEMENELLEGRRGRDEALSRCKQLQDELQRNLNPSTMDTGQKLKQEEELEAAAEKLAECQETIFLLRRQLKPTRVQQPETPVSCSAVVRGPWDEDGYAPAETDPEFLLTITKHRQSPSGSGSRSGSGFGSGSGSGSGSGFGSGSGSGSGSTSSSTSTPEKHTHGLTRFFSAKGMNGY